MDVRYERQLKRGLLEIIVLKLLSQGRAYGYQLLQRLDQESGGLFRIKEGTLYPHLVPFGRRRPDRVGMECPRGQERSQEVLPLYTRREPCFERVIGIMAQI